MGSPVKPDGGWSDMGAGIVIQHSGPLWYFQDQIIREYMHRVMDGVAAEGVRRLSEYGNAYFEYRAHPPTGLWDASLAVDNFVTERVIRDNVVYNEWLEGVSERNQASSFKGYRLWRMTTQDLNAQKYEIAEDILILGGYLERLNGV